MQHKKGLGTECIYVCTHLKDLQLQWQCQNTDLQNLLQLISCTLT